MALNTLGLSHDKFLSANDYLLGIQQRVRTFNVINVVDKPYTISNAAITTPVNIQLPSLVQMMYYNYYTASVNCPYQVQDLSCYYCDKIKNDITHYIRKTLTNYVYCFINYVFSSRQQSSRHECYGSGFRKPSGDCDNIPCYRKYLERFTRCIVHWWHTLYRRQYKDPQRILYCCNVSLCRCKFCEFYLVSI